MHSATQLPLHGGKAPRWLFKRMVKLARAISLVTIDEFGSDEFVRRLSDSSWFQALSCTIGYDWHSSGTTTVTVGALKEALNDTGEVFVAGGKGKAGLKTPEDITAGVDLLSIPQRDTEFKELSRLAAKIDAGMVYEGIGIYQHSFIFNRSGKWTVIQQAMQKNSSMAVRFQWFSELVDGKDIANEPHASINTETHVSSLDLTAKDNGWARSASVDVIEEYAKMQANPELVRSYPSRHHIIPQVDLSKRGVQMIIKANEIDPKDYKELLLIKGVGRSTLRSLAMVSSLIYDRELSYRDPVAYAYTLGGKDRIPFPINRQTYDSVVEVMEHLVDKANIETGEKYGALKRLNASLNTRGFT
jgi:uncharacterized protein